MLLHRALSGWFPTGMPDYDPTQHTWVMPINPAIMTNLYWLLKSYDWKIDLAYSILSYSAGNLQSTETGTLKGTGTVNVYQSGTTNFLLPRQRTPFQSIGRPVPFFAGLTHPTAVEKKGSVVFVSHPPDDRSYDENINLLGFGSYEWPYILGGPGGVPDNGTVVGWLASDRAGTYYCAKPALGWFSTDCPFQISCLPFSSELSGSLSGWHVQMNGSDIFSPSDIPLQWSAGSIDEGTVCGLTGTVTVNFNNFFAPDES